MKNKKETWVDCYYYSNKYEVSNFGRVRNKLTKHLYTTRYDRCGYEQITLTLKGKRITVKIHRLIYLSFNPTTPLHLHVHHLDHNKLNNKLNNLGAIDKKTHLSMHAKFIFMTGKSPLKPFKRGVEHTHFKGAVIALCPMSYEIKHVIYGSAEMRSLGFSTGAVSRAVNGYVKQYKGFLFKRIPKTLKVDIGQIFDNA
jgi:hypothetical protein